VKRSIDFEISALTCILVTWPRPRLRLLLALLISLRVELFQTVVVGDKRFCMNNLQFCEVVLSCWMKQLFPGIWLCTFGDDFRGTGSRKMGSGIVS